MTRKKGGEPAHVHALYAFFVDLLRRQYADAEAMSQRLSLGVEWQPVNATYLEYVAPEEAVALLVDPPKEPQWIFWGRLLRHDQDAQILGDPEALGSVLEEVLCSLVPYWMKTNHRGHQILRG